MIMYKNADKNIIDHNEMIVHIIIQAAFKYCK